MAGWQWWQYVGAAVTLLGLSPAPWIGAMLTRRLMPLGAHLERVNDIKESHKREVETLNATHDLVVVSLKAEIARITEEREYERAGRETERSRSDVSTARLGDLAREFGDSTVQLLHGIQQQAGERAPSG